MSDVAVWTVIVVLGIGTYAMRAAFLGGLGGRSFPEPVARWLRYTASAVLPALIAPAVVFPAATGGTPDPARLVAAAVTVVVGVASRSTLAALVAGMATLQAGLRLF